MHSDCTTLTKTCTKCGETKPATAEYFYRQRQGRYGVSSRCKACAADYQRVYLQVNHERRAAWHRTYKEREAELHRIWYANNKERHAKSGRTWVEANKERWREYRRAYQAARRETLVKRSRAWYYANKERASEWSRAYRAANPDKLRAKQSRRRAYKLQAEGTHTDADIQAQFSRQRGRCYWCGKKVEKDYHVDHIVPLSRGGSNWPDNLVIACGPCNESKGAKLPHEWPQGGRLI